MPPPTDWTCAGVPLGGLGAKAVLLVVDVDAFVVEVDAFVVVVFQLCPCARATESGVGAGPFRPFVSHSFHALL